MRSPNGFGKCYFSLASILAHAITPVLHATQVRYGLVVAYTFDNTEEEETEDPPPEIHLSPLLFCLQNVRPCHCNCYFRLRTLLLLKLIRRIPKCNCNCRFFSFRRTGTHPPILSFFELFHTALL